MTKEQCAHKWAAIGEPGDPRICLKCGENDVPTSKTITIGFVQAVAEAAWQVLNHDNDPHDGQSYNTKNWHDLTRAIRNVLQQRFPDETTALHASAPAGLKCADCTMDGEACPDCYAAWWRSRHPHTQVIGSAFERCCERDHDNDGNCDIHSAPGVFRRIAFNIVPSDKQDARAAPEASGDATGSEGDDSNMSTALTTGPVATSSQGNHIAWAQELREMTKYAEDTINYAFGEPMVAISKDNVLAIATVLDAPYAVSDSAYPQFIDIVFDGPPGPESGRFVEVENEKGASISCGVWIDRGDGLHALRIGMGLREMPTAWMHWIRVSGSPVEPAEWDVELVYGDDQPEGKGWIPLYMRRMK
jgi:hypothetical protein